MGKKILMVLLVMALLISLPVFSYAFTNEIPISTNTDGSIFNGVGYQQGYRLSSSGTLSTSTYSYVTGFIPVSFGDTVYMQDVTFQSGVTSGLSSANQRICFYDSSKTFLGVVNAASTSYAVSVNTDNVWNGFTVKSLPNVDLSNVAYFRINGSYIGSDSVISVNEEIPVFRSVSVSSSSGGSASADVSTSYAGQTVTLTATPNTDYYFSHWEVLSGGVTISNNKFTMPDADVSVKAVFAPIEYDISVSSSSGGTASANLSKATYGQTVTLTATPADGYTFSEWQVTSGNASVINNQFIMPRGDVSVKAVFLPIPVYSVTVESDGNGVGSANPTSGYAGTAVTLSAVPALGYEFDRWEVTSGSVSIVNDEFTLPAADVVIKAHFKPIVYTITLKQGSNGSATVSKTTGIIGDVITLTATPDENYNFNYWDVIEGGISVDGNSFIMPASNVVIKPVFTKQSAVSSGFTFNSGIIDDRGTTARLTSGTFDFGEQPAGEYLINIYSYGQNYGVSFDLSYGSDVVNGKKIPYTQSGGVTSAVVTHTGGELILSADINYFKSVLNSVYAYNVSGNFYDGAGMISSVYVIASSGNWVFNITDVVAIPVDIADSEDYGIYSSIVSFLKGQFRELISVFGGKEAEEDVNQAADELNQEVEDLNNLSGQLDEQKNNLENQFENDFKISDDLTNQTGNIQLIYTGIFDSFGIFSIFIWLPVVLVVIKKLLRL